jgi:hypothetical protein
VLIVLAATPLARNLAYMAHNGAVPVQIAIAHNGEKDGPSYSHYAFPSKSSDIRLPLVASATSPDTVVVIEGNSLAVDGDDGLHWSSKWNNTSTDLTADPDELTTDFDFPADLVPGLAKGHPRAKVELALAIYQLHAPNRIDSSPARFDLPGAGICGWSESRIGDIEFADPICATALRAPDLVLMRLESADIACKADRENPRLTPGHYALGYQFDEGPFPADFDANPVHKLTLSFGEWIPKIPSTPGATEFVRTGICRGTVFTMRTGTLVDRRRVTVDLGELRFFESPSADVKPLVMTLH